jgi:hypothetical protein
MTMAEETLGLAAIGPLRNEVPRWSSRSSPAVVS